MRELPLILVAVLGACSGVKRSTPVEVFADMDHHRTTSRKRRARYFPTDGPLVHPAADDENLWRPIVSTATSTPTPGAAEAGYDRTEPRTSAVALWGLAVIIVLISVIAGVQAVFDQIHERQVYRRVLNPVAESLIDVRRREQNRLHSYQHLATGGHAVRPPIDRAMELIAAECAAGRFPYSTLPAPLKVEPDAGKAAFPEGNQADAAKD